MVFFLDDVGVHPCWGGNRAFMAEPSDRPALNDGLGGRKKWCRDEKREEMKQKRWEKKNFSNQIRTIQTSREKMVKSVRSA